MWRKFVLELLLRVIVLLLRHFLKVLSAPPKAASFILRKARERFRAWRERRQRRTPMD